MGWRVGLVLVFAVGFGCGGGETASDASPNGASCHYNWDCPLDIHDPFECDDGVCLRLCRGVDGGTGCNLGVSDFPRECCRPDEHCCTVGFEHEGCFPEDRPCYYGCPQNFDVRCESGKLCAIKYVHAHHVPADGTCESNASGPPYAECVDECPVGTIACGWHRCCGQFTRCEEHCCVAAPPDAGIPDAGTDDAGTDDAGVADAGT